MCWVADNMSEIEWRTRTSSFTHPVITILDGLFTKDSLAWLRCWVLLSFLTIGEMAVDPGLELLPFYLLVKLVCVAWYFGPAAYTAVKFLVSSYYTFLLLMKLLFRRLVCSRLPPVPLLWSHPDIFTFFSWPLTMR